MPQKKPSARVFRKAENKDLQEINKKFGMVKKYTEKDLDQLAIIEINGKIRAITPYTKEQGFKARINDPLINTFTRIVEETENKSKEASLELKKLIKKHGKKKVAKMYQEKMNKIFKE